MKFASVFNDHFIYSEDLGSYFEDRRRGRGALVLIQWPRKQQQYPSLQMSKKDPVALQSKRDCNRRLKRKEKENLWRRNNRKNCKSDPVVVHFPKDNLHRSALQTLHKESGKSRDCHYFQGGLNHDWVESYHKAIISDQSCVNEWNAMDSLESKRPSSPDSLTNQEETQTRVRHKLKEIMMNVDIDEVTSKYIRQRLEDDLQMNLFKYKSFIDEEMLIILGQMDAATEIFPHVYLGSEWNASNLEELKRNGVGFILNVTKEIDNFFPGMFDYLNIRVYDDEKTELLKHWDDTYKYINQAKEKNCKVLVHCKMGISRSASVVIAYSMKAYNYSLDEAVNFVKSKRSCINPNQAFRNQLKIYQGILDASKQRHNVLWRSKSETNLKSPSAKNVKLRSSHHKSFYRHSGLSSDITVVPHFKVDPKQFSKDERLTLDNVTSDNGYLNVPSPSENKRPKSWSPDEDTARLIFNESFKSDTFGDAIQKSQSLNDQTWQAHVTVEQREHRGVQNKDLSDIESIDRPILVEAYNPLYVPPDALSSPTSTSQPTTDDLQLSSSVKDRINEFESAQIVGAKQNSSNASCNTKEVKSPRRNSPTSLLIPDVTTDSSNDFETGESNTKILDDVIETLSTFTSSFAKEFSASSPDENSSVANAHKEHSSLKEPSTTPVSDGSNSSVVVVPNESITWAAGIVKKQKEDFEEKVKVLDNMSKSYEKLKDVTDASCNRLTRSASSVTAAEATKSHNEQQKKDDFFSSSLDKVFDREERKESHHSATPETNEPSRNSSWSSFDSAVFFIDREAPSRHNSWGSCDTRYSAGSIPSRNSSFGAFDTKQSAKCCLNSDRSITLGPLSLSQTVFDKDCNSFSPATLRRNKVNKENTNPVSEQKVEFDTKKEVTIDVDNTKIGLNFDNGNGNKTDNAAIRLKHTPQSPEHEIPLPGTVKQQKEKLENRTKSIFTDKNAPDIPDTPSFVRSFSSGDVDASHYNSNHSLSRSQSEKRNRRESHPCGGKVRKITRALENQKVTLASFSSQLGQNYSTRCIKNSLAKRDETRRKRSVSLERLSNGLNSDSSSLSSNDSQNLDDEESSPPPRDAAVTSAEEKCVKDIVGMFEESHQTVKHVPAKRSHSARRSSKESRIRPRSESISERRTRLPPVPQRKSSLDHPFKNHRSLHQICGLEVRRTKQQGKSHPLSKLTPRENTL